MVGRGPSLPGVVSQGFPQVKHGRSTAAPTGPYDAVLALLESLLMVMFWAEFDGLLAAAALFLGGLTLSYTFSWSCCAGMVFAPFPWVGYVRLDLAMEYWMSTAAQLCLWVPAAEVLTAVALGPPVTRRSRPWRRYAGAATAVVVTIIRLMEPSGYIDAKIMDHYLEGGDNTGFTGSNAVYGRYTLDRLLLPKDESYYWTYSSMLNTSIPAKITSSAAADGKSVRAYAADDGTKGTIKLDHLLGRMSAEPILSRELCAKTIAFAEAKRDLWMNTGGFALPSSFVTFGNNANNMALYTYEDTFAESRFGLAYHRYYGFQRWLGRDSHHMLGVDQAATDEFFAKLKPVFVNGLSKQIASIRAGVANQLNVSLDQIVFGGDKGSIIEDFWPMAIIGQHPHFLQNFYMHPHSDRIGWMGGAIKERVPGDCPDSQIVGFTMALQLPAAGGGLLWWHQDEDGRWLQFTEKYTEGRFMSVYDKLHHSIEPWSYGGWTDKTRYTMQMFAQHCGSKYYFFH